MEVGGSGGVVLFAEQFAVRCCWEFGCCAFPSFVSAQGTSYTRGSFLLGLVEERGDVLGIGERGRYWKSR